MKKLKLDILWMLLVMSLSSTTLLFGQPWQKNFGGDAISVDVKSTPDGGFVGTQRGAFVAFKVDADGQDLWSYALPADYQSPGGQSLEILPNGDMLIVGQTSLSNPGFQSYLFILKLDTDGALIWEEYVPINSPSAGPFLVTAIGGGGFYIGGQYGFLMKIDDNGNEEWRITSQGMRGLAATTDGGVIYLVNDNTTGSDLLFVRKRDANGSAVWSKSIAGNGNLVGRQLTGTNDGGVAITGFDSEVSSSSYFILKLDGDGNTQFLEYFDTPDTDAGQGLDQTQDGGYLVTGWSYFGERVTRLTRLDDQGMVLWGRNYGSGEGLAVQEVSDQSIIMAGRGVRLYHLDADGQLFQNQIVGNIFDDTNVDCSVQAGEPGLAGWTVWARGPIDHFGTTDAVGNYVIDIDTGQYEVIPSLPDFIWQPCLASMDADLAAVPDTSTLAPFLMSNTSITMVTISGYIYQDLDGDCVQDPDEPGIPNCVVLGANEVTWSVGSPQYQVTTNSDGFYSFSVPAGDYYAVWIDGLDNNPDCESCEPEFFHYIDAVPFENNFGLACTGGVPEHVQGFVFFDENENCQLDIGESGIDGWTLQIVAQGTVDTLVFEGDDAFSEGEFSIPLDTGDYYFIITPPNYLFFPCQTVQFVTVTQGGTAPVLFPLMPLATCPKMTVDLGTAFLRPCTESSYSVRYCNEGTGLAEDASIEISLPPDLTMGSTQIPVTALPNNIWSFSVGDVAPGECQNFWFNAFLDCDSETGWTHCVEAHVYPDSICMDSSLIWDGSSVELMAECEGDSVILTISNNGWGNMSEALDFIIVEDNVLIRDSTFQLLSGQTANVVVYPNGATIMLQAQQSFGHPGNSAPVIFIEGCGGDSISIGFVTQYPQDDEDCFIAIDCRESVNSFDPNTKAAQPRGLTDAHFIQPTTDLDYQITFQNLGTADALEVVILDTLSQKLDTASLRVGAASHPYTWTLRDDQVLEFTFENINLPPASVDSMGSIGFVKFQIAQTPGNQPGDLIENQAGIYFDFNDPILTNTVTHRIPAPEMFATELISLCAGELYNGEVVVDGMQMIDTIQYAFFDSITTTKFAVLPMSTTVLTEAICEGESYIFNGEILMEADDYEVVLTDQNGCDSLVQLNLDVYPDQSSTLDTAIIAGEHVFGVPVFSDTTMTQQLVDGNGCFYDLTIHVTLIVSTSEVKEQGSIQLSPNPNDGRFFLDVVVPSQDWITVKLFSAYGQVIKTICTDQWVQRQLNLNIDETDLPSGMYYLMVRGEDWQELKRVIVR